MDVDEQGASNVVAGANDDCPTIASSSNVTVHLPLQETFNSDSDAGDAIPSSSKQCQQSLQPQELKVNNDPMVTENNEAVRPETDTVLQNKCQSNGINGSSDAGYGEDEHQNEQHVEYAGIDPNYPLVLVQRLSLPPPVEGNNEDYIAMDQENHNVEEEDFVMEGCSVSDAVATFNSMSAACSDGSGNRDGAITNTIAITDQKESSDVVFRDRDPEIASSSNLTSFSAQNSKHEDDTIPSSSKQLKKSSEQEENATNNDTMVTDNLDEVIQETDTVAHNERQSLETGEVIRANYNEEEHQNEQHIENAGIDPNYPLVLVQRVSLPSPGDNSGVQSLPDENNENGVAMDEENQNAEEEDSTTERRSVSDAMAIFNSISAAATDNDDEDDDDDDEYVNEVWSEEEEDEAAFLENPNFRGFANQFEAIRNMIAHTRRSMAEAEANFGPAPPNSFMQRFRRMLFILNNRRRRLIRLGLAASDVELPEAEVNAEIEAANEESSENDDAEITDNPANNLPNNAILEQELEINENAVQFDTNLPAQHSYMGTNMNRVAGVNYLEVDQYAKIRLFMHQQLLFPGEDLPFMVDSSSNLIETDGDDQNGILFGVCFPYLSIKPPTNGEIVRTIADYKDEYCYGVTCQVYELGEDNRSNVMVKSRALQRFKIKASDLTTPLEFLSSNARMKCYGYVKILPDVYLPDPLKCMNMGSMNRFRDNTSMQDTYKRFQSATTPWPAYVYEAHNITNITEKARTQLAQHKINIMPSDPIQLSYWLVRNLHIPEDMLKTIFLANTVNTRLKLIASTFKKENIFSCRNCAIHIADCRELFAMSKNGVQQQYCNSEGYIHKTNTLYQVNRNNILYSGSPSTRFSWFPGYQWHIIICKICKHHLGWEFKAVEPNLVPNIFFGIASSSVRIRLAEERNNVPEDNSVYMNFLRLMNAEMNEWREGRNNIPHV